jgi:regulator of nucleoside diphosphate kinase
MLDPRAGEYVLRRGQPHRGGNVMNQTVPITLTEGDLQALRELVARNVTTRDAAAAAQLEEEIERARVVGDDEAPADLVTLNSRVEFVDARGRARVVQLVLPAEADAEAGRVSVLAPIGAALLGLSVGQSIEWPLPNGTTAEVQIIGVTRAGPALLREAS